MDGLPDILRRHLVVVSPPLVPEVRVHAAEFIVPIWEATEALAGRPLSPPFWAFAWPGSQALARYVLDHPRAVQGKRVLDFAAGNGLAAIAAVRAGASEVVANDVDELALVAVGANAALNEVVVPTTSEDLVATGVPEVDLILAGDVCYEREPSSLISAWLRSCARSGTDVLLADPGRTYVPSEGLELIAEYVVPTTRELEQDTTMRTRIWRVLG